jgi:mannosyl-3-phosphoglycerate phosphatase
MVVGGSANVPEAGHLRSKRKLVVMTDVDGCLVDHSTYSHAAADVAVERLKAAGIPLVLCSSKTRAELERLHEELGLTAPFVVENGGALYVPAGTFPFGIPGARYAAGYEVLEFGRPRSGVVATLLKTAARLGIEISTFSGMSVERVAEECGLSLAEARLAKLREYDEPFRLVDPDRAARDRLCRALRSAGLRCSGGGRYDHVTGGTDKGAPVATIRRLYTQMFGEVAMVGLGDSLNDLELLNAVDIPVVVRNRASDTSALLLREVRGATVTSEEGPAGWQEAVAGLLGSDASAGAAVRAPLGR